MKRYNWTLEKMEALYFLRRIAKAYIKMNDLLKTENHGNKENSMAEK